MDVTTRMVEFQMNQIGFSLPLRKKILQSFTSNSHLRCTRAPCDDENNRMEDMVITKSSDQ